MNHKEFRAKYLNHPPIKEVSRLSKTNPFVDFGKTHTFSDWLLAYAFEFGYEPDEKIEPGALPDLSPTLKRGRTFTFHEEKLSEHPLLPLGDYLKKYLPNRFFLDLGCGDPNISIIPAKLAESFKAKGYVGVDLHHVQDGTRTDKEFFFRMDLLEFLGKLEPSFQKVIFLSGIDPKSDSSLPYLEALREELIRVALKDDLVILGAGTTGLDLEKRSSGYELLYHDSLHDLFKFKRR